MEYLLAAMIFIESGGDPNVIGKHGERGPLQIKRVYWNEACEQLAREGTPRSQLPSYDRHVKDFAASKRIVQAYWRRYCAQAYRDRDWETLARVHNGGPSGDRKSSTVGYWRRVQPKIWQEEANARLARQKAELAEQTKLPARREVAAVEESPSPVDHVPATADVTTPEPSPAEAASPVEVAPVAAMVAPASAPSASTPSDGVSAIFATAEKRAQPGPFYGLLALAGIFFPAFLLGRQTFLGRRS